ncbi:hypothetical protein ACE6H2_026164 [Prunus campanulata]
MPPHLVAVPIDVGKEASVAIGKGIEKIVVPIHMAGVKEAIHPREAQMHPGIRGKRRQAMCLEMLKALVTDVAQRDIGRVHAVHRHIRRIFINLHLRIGKWRQIILIMIYHIYQPQMAY